MGYISIPDVKIRGISACVPKQIERNADLSLFPTKEDLDKFIQTTGIIERRVVDSSICSSDLCYHAAEKLIEDLKWDREGIDCLIFITQTPDYIVPATACILQNRLGLSNECHAFDVTLGCSAWTYGLSIMGSLLTSGNFKKGLLLVGETTTKTKSKKDKSTYPLFGDAGSATAMEFLEGSPDIKIHSGTDGSKFELIKIPDGGFRSPTTQDSLVAEEIKPGVTRNKLQYIMDGAGVFTFTISKVPKNITGLIERYSIDKEKLDFLVLHQANKIIVDKISSKLRVPKEKVPVSYDKFGNTSCASIPLTIVHRLNNEMKEKELSVLACGFGGGLSLASVYFETDKIICPSLIEI